MSLFFLMRILSLDKTHWMKSANQAQQL